MKKFLIPVFLGMLILPLPARGEAPDFNPNSVAVIFSSNVQGEIEPCG